MHGDDPFRRRWTRYLIAAATGVIALITLIAGYGYVTGAPWVGMVEYTYDAGWRVTSSDGYKFSETVRPPCCERPIKIELSCQA